MKGKKLTIYKESLVLNDIQKEVLVGTLLGDATITKQKLKSNYNVKFEQKYENKAYVSHLYEIFKDFVGTGPFLREIKGGGAADRYSLWFRTYRHSLFTEYYNIFYKNGVKIVPLNLDQILTSRSLAYWFMDDGSTSRRSNYNEYILNTQAFTIEDQLRICKIFTDKFNFDSLLHKDGNSYRICIKRSFSNEFKALVNPFIVDCMKYKL